MHEVRPVPHFEKDLRRAPAHIVEGVIASFDEMARDPTTPRSGFDTTAMTNAPGHYRLRIGRWRVFYAVDHQRRLVIRHEGVETANSLSLRLS